MLAEMQTVPTLPADFPGTSSAAEIGVLANGKFLYTSNRGHDSIARFAIDENTGRLTALGSTPSRGKTPRYFIFDATQRWMLVSHQDSDNLALFRVDGATGELTPHGETISIPRPLGIAFLNAP
jgi:6-phosphogluconolactonase